MLIGRPVPRAFFISDGMILVAATAVGFAILRFVLGDLQDLRAELNESWSALFAPPDGRSPWSWAIISGYGLLMTIMSPFCWSWTLATSLLCLRRPRPPLRRLVRQPGVVACFTASCGLVVPMAGLVWLLLVWYRVPTLDFDASEWQKTFAVLFILTPAFTGFAVAGAWLTLLLGRRWRPEPTWFDRIGRVLGLYWVGCVFLPVWAFS